MNTFIRQKQRQDRQTDGQTDKQIKTMRTQAYKTEEMTKK